MKFEPSMYRNMCHMVLVTIALWVIQLSEAAAPAKPTITDWPTSNTANKGTTLTLTCSSASGATSYEWYKGTAKLTSGGTNNAVYTKDTVAETDAGEYYCKAINTGDSPHTSTDSDKKTLTVAVPPALASELTVNQLTTTGATVKWTTTTGTFDNFKVTFTPTAGGAATETKPAKTATQEVTTGLQAGTEYTARVVTVLGTVEGPPKTMTFYTLPPDIPADLTVSPITATGATVTWTKAPSGNFESYEVTISPTTNGAKVDTSPVQKTVDPPTTTLSSLTPNTEYTVTVKTVVGSTKGAAKTKIFTTLPPDITADLTITAITATGGTVEWTKPAGTFTSYEITISPTDNGAKVDTSPVQQSVDPPKTTLSNLTPNTEYTVTVKTVAGSTKGAAKTTKFTTLPPDIASDLTFSAITATGGTVQWSKPSAGTFTSYEITISPTDNGAKVDTASVLENVEPPKTTLLSLTPGTEYTVTVRTVVGSTKGTEKTKKFTTLPPPLASELKVGTTTSSTAIISWTKTTGNFDSYKITISPITNTETASTVAKDAEAPTTTLSNLKSGQEYTVTVSTQFTTGSVVGVAKTTKVTTLPPDIGVVTVSAVSKTGAEVTWAKVTTGKFDTYEITLTPADGGATATPTSVASTEASPKTVLSSLTAGTEYTVTIWTKITAKNVEGVKKEKKFTTMPPNIVSELTVNSITMTGASVTWTKSTGSFTSYKIEISPTKDGAKVDSPTVLKAVDPPLTTLSSLTPGTEYTITVRTVMGTKEGEPKTKTFTTAPNKPTIKKEKFYVDDQVITGSDVTMTCSAEGVVTLYEWYKGTTKLKSTGDKEAVYTKKVADTDAGEYTCKAINTGGSTGSDKVTLKVVGPCANTLSSDCGSGVTRCSLCKNGATCVPDQSDASKPKCTCTPGWEGPTSCSIDINECIAADTCHAEAVCTNTPGSFSCKCKSGYSGDGKTCTDIDECTTTDANLKHKCRSFATCTNTPGSYTCACNSGYEGDGKNYCHDINECTTTDTSLKHKCTQKCKNSLGSYSCSCAQGYTLENSDKKTCKVNTACTTNGGKGPCTVDANTGCAQIDSKETCVCLKDGYALNTDKTKCEDIDECKLTGADAKCKSDANAVCKNVPGSYECGCKTGFGVLEVNGIPQCSDMDECSKDASGNKLDNCHANARCTNTYGSFKCTCKTGYTGNGVTCTEVDECKEPGVGGYRCSQKCENKPLGSYTCSCEAGFTLEADKVSCKATEACGNGSRGACTGDAKVTMCAKVSNVDTCFCKAGYALNGTACEDINECTTTDPAKKHKCHANAECTNTNGSYTCTCKTGYSGDGMYTCNDIDECKNAETHRCSQKCKNTPAGSYTCECEAGFQLQTDKKTCKATTACSNGGMGPCIAGSLDRTMCAKIGGTDKCFCRAGFKLDTDDKSCIVENECSSETKNDCDKIGGMCSELVVGYSCKCKASYEGDGITCKEIDECAMGTDNCHKTLATCINTPGSYECKCNLGYTGDGVTCTDYDECKNPATNKCQQNCTNTIGSYTCSCEDGFVLQSDKLTCKAKVECDTNGKLGPCKSVPAGQVMCAKFGETNAPKCVCNRGYSLQPDDLTCTEINSCRPSPCSSPSSSCHVNKSPVTGETVPGGFTCGCNDGSISDGLGSCKEICPVTPNKCKNGANYTCWFYTPYYKCQCQPGYTGTNCEIEINECMTEPCKNKGQCTNDPPGSYTCHCPKGYDPKTDCGDVDECTATDANKHNCLANVAECTNTVGSFTCACKDTKVGDGVTVCIDDVLLQYTTTPNKIYGNNVLTDIEVKCGIPFGDKIYRNIKVCTNGYFSLEPNDTNRADIVLSQVSSIKDLRKMLIVAPYLTHMDIKEGAENGPTLYYDVYSDVDTDEKKKDVSKKINSIIQKFPTATSFSAKLAVVATWDKVSPIDGTTYKDETFTFQGVLASNGTHSYAIFLYQPGSMKWDKDTSARKVFIGYQSDINLYEHPASFSKTAMGIDLMKGTNDTIGVWAHPIGAVKTNSYQKCCDWEESVANDTVTRSAAAVCPATLLQLKLMDMMEKDTTSSGDCYVQYAKTGDYWQRCCYSKTGGLLEGVDCGYIRVDKKEATDKEGWQVCCATDMCSTFKAKRPCSKKTAAATPGSAGMGIGDPHIVTHDNVTWTFNGLGEWIMVRTKQDKTEFQLQARTALAPAPAGFDPKATSFTAFAMKAKDTEIVQVGLNATDDRLDILVNKKAGPTMASLTTINRSNNNMVLQNVAGTFVARFLTSGFVVKVSNANKMLNMTVVVPSKYKKQTSGTEQLEGLMGNYDGVKTNEWLKPGSGSIAEGSTEKEYYTYGTSWKVPEADSLFHYVAPNTYASYQKSDFVPLFSDEHRDKLLTTMYNGNQALLTSCNKTCMSLWRTKESERKPYYACLFDGGRMQDCKASSALVEQIQLYSQDVNILQNHAPSFENKPLIFNYHVGKPATFTIKLSDPDKDDVVTLKVSGAGLPDSTINDVEGKPMEKTFTWKPTNTSSYKLTLAATDKLQAETLIDVELRVCNCQKEGQCEYTEVVKKKNPDNFYLAECTCPGDYKGRWCEISPCNYTVTPCYSGVTCTVDNSLNKAKCGDCPKGMTDGTPADPGKNCLDIDECLADPKPCKGEGVKCVNTIGSFFCQCPTGMRPKKDDITTCEDVNECLNPSLGKCNATKNEMCENLKNTGYRCVCKTGYEKKEGACVDINECTSASSKHNCNANATCNNTVGSFTCTCNAGYTGNGVTCTDIDECFNPKDNSCDQTCTNTVGSYKCTCKTGFELNADNKTCKVLSANACTVKKTCAHYCTKEGTTETCSCRAGYVVDGDNCKVEDMCAKKTDKCTQTCEPDSNGGYTCTCKDGYKLDADKFTCRDIDECKDGKNNCAKSADGGMCTNTDGNFTCQCAAGYTGNGTHCNETDECKTVKCPANSVCQNAPGTYDCICHALYYKKDGSCVRAPMTWNGTISFSETYDADFKNPAAKKTQAYEKTFTETIKKTLKSQYGDAILDIRVIRFDNGSIRPQYLIYTDASGNISPTGLQGAVQNLVTKNTDGTCVMHMSDGTSRPLDCTSNKIIDYNECAAGYDVHQCPQGTHCVNEEGSYKCKCKPGYKLVQSNPASHIELCDDINECSTECKLPLTNCTNTPGSYTCKCNLGYWSTDANKIKCTEACGPKPCQNGGECVADISKEGGFRCVCPAHYEGKVCEDINPKYAEMRTIAIAVGCTVGALALILLIILIVMCVRRHRSRSNKHVWTVSSEDHYRRRASNKDGYQGNGNDKADVSLETYKEGYLPRVQSRPVSAASLANENVRNGNNRRRNNDDRSSRSSNDGTDNPAFENPVFENRQNRNNQDNKYEVNEYF